MQRLRRAIGRFWQKGYEDNLTGLAAMVAYNLLLSLFPVALIALFIAGRELRWTLSDEARRGDHRWWISDLRPFTRDYPDWEVRYDVEGILREIHAQNAEAWQPVT